MCIEEEYKISERCERIFAKEFWEYPEVIVPEEMLGLVARKKASLFSQR